MLFLLQTVLHYRSLLLRSMQTLVMFPLYVANLLEQSQMIDVEIFPKFFDDLVRLLMIAPKSVLIKHYIRLQSQGCTPKSV